MGIHYESQTRSLRCEYPPMLGKSVHMHKELEIVYVKSGSAIAYVDRQTYRLQQGDLFFAFPNQIHYYETLERGEFLLLICSPHLIYDCAELLSAHIPTKNVIESAIDDPSLAPILELLQKLEGDYAKTAAFGYLNALLSVLLPRVKLTKTDSKKSSLASVIVYCTRHFQEDLTLDAVANELHLSKYYVSHLINRELNRNFNDYINDLRVGAACKLLSETHRKIADISEEVGFGTIRSFNRAFQASMHQTPAQWRAAMSHRKKS